MEHKDAFVEAVLDLLWAHWTLLGVRGATPRTNVDYAISLEELLILTAEASVYDPRLRDEALDWCIHSGRFICKPRLKTLLGASQAETRSAFGSFSTILGQHLGGTWPVPSPPEFKFTATNKSLSPNLTQPALLSLKLRALFWVGARADILSSLLAWPAPTFVASDLSFVGYTKRNVAIALDWLVDGGLLSRSPSGNRVNFSWKKHSELLALLQPTPVSIPRWPSIQRVLSSWLHLLSDNETRSPRLGAVAASRSFNSRALDTNTLALSPPVSKPINWTDVADWIVGETQSLAAGTSPILYPRASLNLHDVERREAT